MVEHQSGMLSKIDPKTAVPVDATQLSVELVEDVPDAVLGDEEAGTPITAGHAEDAVDQIPEPESDPVEDALEAEKVLPDLDTADWMSQLREDEVFNSAKGPAPRLHGLRRLAKPYILREESKVNALTIVPRQYVRTLENTNGEGAVMSRHEEVGTHHFPMASVTFNITLLDGRTFSDSADAFYSNCEELGLFPTAVASARAEARCLRKVLGINEHAAEEIVDKDAAEELAPDDDSRIKPEQAKLIDKMLGQLEITLKDLLEQITTREVFSVEELTTGEARKALRLLNEHKKKAKKAKKKS